MIRIVSHQRFFRLQFHWLLQIKSPGDLPRVPIWLLTPFSCSIDAEIQFVWNLDYVDDLVLRDRDTTANGTLNERLYSLHDLRSVSYTHLTLPTNREV